MLRSILDILASALNACSAWVLSIFNGIDNDLLAFVLACMASFMVCVIIGRLIHHGGMGLSKSDFDKSNPKKQKEK